MTVKIFERVFGKTNAPKSNGKGDFSKQPGAKPVVADPLQEARSLAAQARFSNTNNSAERADAERKYTQAISILKANGAKQDAINLCNEAIEKLPNDSGQIRKILEELTAATVL